MSEGTLFVVATPIGNLDDLSPRAREVLATADLIAAEDTRVTGRLLSHFGIKRPQMALHEYNEAQKVAEILGLLRSGKSIALVSDAGTPLISDPGFDLIRSAHLAGIPVSPVPGASALLAALSVSGLPTDRFSFEGFLPAKQAARKKRLGELADETRTMVFYESVHRIQDTIRDMAGAFGAKRLASIGRELTKLHEQCVSTDLGTLEAMLADGRIAAKGEFVIVVTGSAPAERGRRELSAAELLEELVAVLPGSQAVDITARIFGASRNELYQQMLDLKKAGKCNKT